MKLSVVLPVYNEGEMIQAILCDLRESLRELDEDFEIVVVDNGSTDNTPLIINSLQKKMPEIHVVRVFPNEGYGNGVLAGLSAASGEILGWMPGDGQLEARDVAAVYKKLVEEELDFCKGVRIPRGDHWFRIVQSAVFNLMFQLLFGRTSSDINAAPKIFRRKFYEEAKFSSRDWFLDAEAVIKAIRMRAKSGEIPVRFFPRTTGASKVHALAVFEFLKNLALYRFRFK